MSFEPFVSLAFKGQSCIRLDNGPDNDTMSSTITRDVTLYVLTDI